VAVRKGAERFGIDAPGGPGLVLATRWTSGRKAGERIMRTIFSQTILSTIMLFLAAARASAGGFAILHDFSARVSSTNSDGAYPNNGILVLSGNVLYGATLGGGSGGHGVVFRVNTDGTGFTNLYNFSAYVTSTTNSDGAQPFGGLLLSADTLYGTAMLGGSEAGGTVFRVNTDGMSFTNLHNFSATTLDTNTAYPTNTDGIHPYATLALSGNTLYGTASAGGTAGVGTVFNVDTDGAAFTNLYTFSPTSIDSQNSDGAGPQAGLVQSGNTLYGTAASGGSAGFGTVFRVDTDGTAFTNLHNFTGSDGLNPSGGYLVLSGNTLYGTTYTGGTGGVGTVFRVNTDGGGFTNLHHFTGSDGANPAGGLVLSGGTLYGTTYAGGSGGIGTVFQVNTDGTSFTNLYHFSGSDGSNPFGGLVLSGKTLYGTTRYGGSANDGVVFALTMLPALNIQVRGTDVILNWSDPAFSLQAAPSLTDVFTNVPAATSPYTNPISGPQQFFRLKAQ
jgi:uncharacterized repeat protein (TIGR03803 family)